MSRRPRKSSPVRRPVSAPVVAAVPGSARQVWLLPALWLVVLVAYQPVWHGGVLWDDAGHLTRGDLQSLGGLWRIWFEMGATQQYYPAVHSAFWLLHRLWGDHTLGYHLVNITLHASSAFLIAVLLRRLEVPGAMLAATIFALHPVQVESVAWMSELKNMLSGVCYLSAALAYLRFDERRDARSYALAFALFAIAVLSKTVTATLPAALLVVFWWKRGRVSLSRDVRPLGPFFVAGVAGGLVTAWFEHSLIGAQGSEFQLTVVERALVAGRVLWFYLGALVWPARLMFVYPKWTASQAVWWQYLFPAAAAALVWLLWRARSRSRGPLAAVLLFGGTLSPALGFVNVYPFRFSYVADHFQYLAAIPMIALFSAAVVTLAARLARGVSPVMAEAGLALAIGAPLACLTWAQSHEYVDADRLFLATLTQNPDCWMCHDNLAVARLRQTPADLPDAVAHLRASLQLHSDNAEAHYNLGSAHERMNRPDEAIQDFRAALHLRPRFGAAHLELAFALDKIGRAGDAEAEFRQAIASPLPVADMATAHYNLGLALAARAQLDEAVLEFEQTLKLTPASARAHDQIAYALFEKGQTDQALVHATEAVRLDPASAEAHDTLGMLFRELDRPEDAVGQYREAVRLVPGSAEYHNNLGGVLLDADHPAEAVAEFTEAARRKPGAAMIHQNLGVALAAMGRLDEAAAESRAALALQPDYPEARANLADVMRRMRKQ